MGKKKPGAIKTAGIREFRAKLSQYVRAVEQGDMVQVTDRGQVVACLVSPEVADLAHLSPVDRARRQMLADGFISRLGTQDKGPLPPVSGIGASKEAVDAALDWTREDKL
jgi:prevent-host-death family protein